MLNERKDKKRRPRRDEQERYISQGKSDRRLRVFAYVVSTIWVALSLIPLYWLLVSSTKDQVDIYKKPPAWLPRIPNTYNFLLEYTPEEWEEGRDTFCYEDAMILTWVGVDAWNDARVGRTTVHIAVDGRIVADATLVKYNYVNNRNYIWNSNKMDGQQVLDKMTQLRQYNQERLRPFRYDLNQKLPSESQLNEQNRYSGEMYQYFTEEGLLRGRLQAVYITRSFSDLFNNYVAAYKWPMSYVGPMGLARAFTNSLIVVFFGILAQWIIIGFAAYAMAKLVGQRIGKYLTVFYLATMMIPGVVTLIPLYLVVEKMHLSNTLWGVILPSVPSAMNLVLFRGFFQNLPQSMFDAAHVDGAGEWRIFFRLVIPMSKPVFGVIALFTFTSLWNDFFWSMLILKDIKMYTMPLMIQKLSNTLSGGRVDLAVSMAMSAIASVPTIIVFAVFQKQMQRGLVFSGIKG